MKVWNGSVVALAICAIGGTGILGCNTFRGAGRDIQNGGQAVENAADNAQNQKAPRDTTQHTIMAKAESGGTISPAGSVNVSLGTDRTYVIRPSSGYHVSDVHIDGRSVGAVDRYTFNNVNESHTISAEFRTNQSR